MLKYFSPQVCTYKPEPQNAVILKSELINAALKVRHYHPNMTSAAAGSAAELVSDGRFFAASEDNSGDVLRGGGLDPATCRGSAHSSNFALGFRPQPLPSMFLWKDVQNYVKSHNQDSTGASCKRVCVTSKWTFAGLSVLKAALETQRCWVRREHFPPLKCPVESPAHFVRIPLLCNSKQCLL